MQQPVAQSHEEVIWDDSMMDLDDYDLQPAAQADLAPEPLRPETLVVDIGNYLPSDLIDDADPSQVRPEALHMRGVDNMSTDDIRLYASTMYPSFEPKIEWIDDTSLNLAYESAGIASSALQAFSSMHIEELLPNTLRPAKPLTGEKAIDGLKVRVAFMGDKKEKGARDRSRWYLFNPPPSEEYERRLLLPNHNTNGSRDSRRRGDRRYEAYPRRRSRSRTPPLNYDDPPRNEGVELFPEKVANGMQVDRAKRNSRSRSPKRRRDDTYSIFTEPAPSADRQTDDLFPAKIIGVKRAAMDTPLISAPRTSLSFGQDTPPRDGPTELFPEKFSWPLETKPESRPLEARISGKSLAERIQDDGGARELFPELVGGGGSGGRRRRRKAADHF